MTDIAGKLWGFCHTLRHDGIDRGDYIERLPAAKPRSDAFPVSHTEVNDVPSLLFNIINN